LKQVEQSLQKTLVRIHPFLVKLISLNVLCVEIVAQLVDANSTNNVSFPDPNGNLSLSNSIFIPASYIQQRSKTTGKCLFLT